MIHFPHIKDYLDHEHPQPTNFEAPLFAGTRKSLGRQLSVTRLHAIYDKYKKDLFPKLLQNSVRILPEDKRRIEDDMIMIDRDNALMDEMGSILFRYEY